MYIYWNSTVLFAHTRLKLGCPCATPKAYMAIRCITPHMPDFATRHHDPDALSLVKEAPSTHQVGGWVGLRASLENSGEEKNFHPCQKLNARSSSLQPSHYTNYGIPVPTAIIIIQQFYKQACNNQNTGLFLSSIM